MKETSVTRWFGAGFERLHPLLQRLHRDGGRLRGEVDVRVRGAIGRRLAARLGVPADRERCAFEVHIGHADGALHWNRRFGDRHEMRSVFVPQGHWPDGCWIETTGPVRLKLAVDVVDGGWQWRCTGVRVRGIPLPLFLFPRTRAGKRIEDGRYRFEVSVALPFVGEVLRYGGLLDAITTEPAGGAGR